MRIIRQHPRLSFALLYIAVGFGFALFDMTLRQGDLKNLVLQIPMMLAAWPAFPIYDILSGNPELIAEGFLELAAVSPLFFAWYRIVKTAPNTSADERAIS